MKNGKEIGFILALLILSIDSFAQSRWQVIKLDDNLSFSFPSDYKQSDTLGQNNFLASTQSGYLQAVKIPQPHAQIKDKKELIEYYKAFKKLTLEQSHGDLVSDSTIKLNELYIRVYEFETYWNDTLEVQENLIVFIDRSMYSFTYAYFKNERLKAAKEKNDFFAGITLTNTDFEDQLTIPSKNDRLGEQIGYILRYVMLSGLILTIVLWFLKKHEQVRRIKSIFSWTFLLFGAVNLLFYFGNIAYGKNLYSFLAIGIICLVIGFILRRLKVPLAKVKRDK